MYGSVFKAPVEVKLSIVHAFIY